MVNSCLPSRPPIFPGHTGHMLGNSHSRSSSISLSPVFPGHRLWCLGGSGEQGLALSVRWPEPCAHPLTRRGWVLEKPGHWTHPMLSS